MINPDFILQSDNFTLRPLSIKDLDALFRLTGDFAMWTYFTADLSDFNVLREWVKEAIEETRQNKRIAFVPVDKKTGSVIGSTSFGNISFRDKRIEIGWTWISKEYQGKGANREIKTAMLEYCFEKLEFERVEFKTDVLNLPARKALLKLGAVEEGILRSHTLMTRGRRRDTIYYSVLKNEWPEVKARYLAIH
jgi:RimJ/RimL family protein N-acetyltransferase